MLLVIDVGNNKTIINQHNLEIENLWNKVVELENRIDNLEQDSLPIDAMTVLAVTKSHYWSAAGRDSACDGQDPPGKPILEVNEGRIDEGSHILVFKTAYDHCKDNPSDPFVKASGGDLYYRSYENPEWYIPKNEVVQI